MVSFYAERIHKQRSFAEGGSPDVGGSSSPRVKRESVQLASKDKRSNFTIFGPRLSKMVRSPNARISTSKDQAELELSAYERYHMGYILVDGGVAEGQDAKFNEDLKSKYDEDPRVFWSDKRHVRVMGTTLVALARYIFSILAGSAGPEREFSRGVSH